ncbi:hypothetical protein BDP81DRAFT_410995, partial [Colletotrichum phormii]
MKLILLLASAGAAMAFVECRSPSNAELFKNCQNQAQRDGCKGQRIKQLDYSLKATTEHITEHFLSALTQQPTWLFASTRQTTTLTASAQPRLAEVPDSTKLINEWLHIHSSVYRALRA